MTEGKQATAAMKAGPQTITRWLLALFTVGICSRAYGDFDQTLRGNPDYFLRRLQGTEAAPEQYRVAVVRLAYWMTQHLPLKLSRCLSVIELAAALAGGLLLYRLLETSAGFRRSAPSVQWFASVAFAALFLYQVDWLIWYHRPETMPTMAILAAFLWLWSRPAKQPVLLAAAIVGLALVQGFVRADVMVFLSAGILLAALMRAGVGFSLPRGAAMVTSALAVLTAGGTQLYLMKVKYPHATYGDIPVFMLPHDYKMLNLWVTCLIVTAPFLWTAAQIWRRRPAVESASLGFLLGGLGYFVLWIMVGRLDEVRIFLPVAAATIPLTLAVALDVYGETGAA